MINMLKIDVFMELSGACHLEHPGVKGAMDGVKGMCLASAMHLGDSSNCTTPLKGAASLNFPLSADELWTITPSIL